MIKGRFLSWRYQFNDAEQHVPALVVSECIHVKIPCLSQSDQFNRAGEIASINVFEKDVWQI